MMDCVEGQPLLLVALFLLTASTPGAVSSPRFFYWLCNDKRGFFTCLVAVAAQPARAGAIRCRRGTCCSCCPKNTKLYLRVHHPIIHSTGNL